MLFADWMTFFLLIGLELVLGIDNILLISIVTGRLKESERKTARQIALALALILRILLVMGAAWITRLTAPVIFGMSWKDIILVSGGAFLLFKAVKEIHHVVEHKDHQDDSTQTPTKRVTMQVAVTQLALLDLVFSIDSVITAVGLTQNLNVIIGAVIISFVIVLIFAAQVSNIIETHPALKVLALSFLVTIGVTLFVEGMGQHVPKGYIYLPMGFALIIELLQMRMSKNASKVGKHQTIQKI